jgi:hypothetical protein
MLKSFIQISYVALLLTGCMTVRSASVSVGSDGTISTSGAPGLPTIQLQFSGVTIPGLESAFFWEAPDGKSSYGGQNLIPKPPDYPDTLSAKVGQSVDIVVASADIPSTLIVTELDDQGGPITASVLQPEADGTPFLLTTHGQYFLQVTARWSVHNFVTFVFQVDSAP